MEYRIISIAYIVNTLKQSNFAIKWHDLAYFIIFELNSSVVYFYQQGHYSSIVRSGALGRAVYEISNGLTAEMKIFPG
ncbi:hypothetical protein N9T35_00555 [bacterium]|nr:hypothetical protein [bacterium]